MTCYPWLCLTVSMLHIALFIGFQVFAEPIVGCDVVGANAMGFSMISIIPTLINACEYFHRTGNCDPATHLAVVQMNTMLTTVALTFLFVQIQWGICASLFWQQIFVVIIGWFHWMLSCQALFRHVDFQPSSHYVV